MAFAGASAGDTELELDVDPQQQTVQASVVVRVAITKPTAFQRFPPRSSRDPDEQTAATTQGQR